MLSIFLLGALLHGGPASPPSDTAVVARMEGRPVVLREVEFCLAPAATAIARLNAGRQPAAAETLRSLIHRALEQALMNKLQWVLAAERGLIRDPSYQTFRTAWLQENFRRHEEHKSGGVVYGPLQLTEEGYHDYALGHIIIRLKELVVPPPAEDQITARAASLRAAASAHRECIRLLRIQAPAPPGPEGEALRSDTAAMVEGALPHLREGWRAELCTLVVPASDGALEDDVLRIGVRLRPGEASPWMKTAEGWEMVRCLSRLGAGTAGPEELAGIARKRLVDEAYATLLKGRRSAVRVTVDTVVVDAMVRHWAERN